MSHLIGIGGYAYSGKDAFADVLIGHDWYKTYMSKYLRKSLEILNPIIDFEFGDVMIRTIRFAEAIAEQGYEAAKEIPEVRRLLQVLGTEVGRELYGRDFWLDLCFADVTRELKREKNVAVTGIRYHNELKMIDSLGGKTVWVSRPGHAAINTHSSDNTLHMEDFDYIFDNNGTLADLEKSVPLFVKDIMDIPFTEPIHTNVGEITRTDRG